LTGIILTTLGLLSLVGMFCFNDRFRTELGRTAFKWRWIVLIPAAVYGLASVFLGLATTNALVPGALGAALQIFMMMFMMVIQWVAMMWIMARPKIDWYMPGETLDDLTWDDYVGNDEIRDKMKDLMDFLQNPEKFRSMGAKLPKGILMRGEPGVGKTYLARIIANEAGVPIAICESSSMQSPFVAVGALMIKSLYKKLRKHAETYGASMVFFDEIDAIGMSRGGQQGAGGAMTAFMGGGAGGGILNALLGCMDGINSNEGFIKKTLRRFNLVTKKPNPVTVITIGATNAPLSALDPALIREGRLDWKITVTTAGDEGRKQQIEYFLKKRPHDETVDVKDLVSDFRGETPVAIDTSLNNAMIRAIRAGREKMSYNDIIMSLWDRNFGLPSPITLGELDKERVAYHEAGHALIAALWPMTGWSCWGASILPRDGALGMVVTKPFADVHTATEEDLSRRILLAVASRAVEELVLKIKMNGFSGDLQSATGVAVAMLSTYGMGDDLISYAALGQQTSNEVTGPAKMIIKAHLELAKELVSENMDVVEEIAQRLLEKRDLDGHEVRKIAEAKAVTSKDISIFERSKGHLERVKEDAKAKKIQERIEFAKAMKAAGIEDESK
jgi:cell division protease FtsH